MPPRAVPAPRDRWLALGLLVLSQVEVWRYHVAGGSVAAALTLGAAAAVMAWRSRVPVVVTACAGLALAACNRWAGEPYSATSVATITIGFFTIGGMPSRPRSLLALGAAMLVGLVATHPLTLNMYLSITFSSFVVPWLLGLLWSQRHQASQARRAQRLAAEEAVAQERARLARELHDVVSHNVGMIAVQAGAADVLLDKDPRRSRESLQAIEEGARATLLELRRMLGLLRDAAPGRRSDGPSLSKLELLLEPVRKAGVEVSLAVQGQPGELPEAADAAAYRVVQEALTNVLAHAVSSTVRVAVRYADDSVCVDVVNDGRARGGTSRGGYGLTGLRERVAALGGTLEAGPEPGGGFRVQALLPLTAP
jgi:signal transduction histidine kinase